MLEYLEYNYSQMLKLNALKSYNLCGSSLVRLYIMQAKSYFYNVKHSDNQRYIRPQAMGFQLSVKLRIKTWSTEQETEQHKLFKTSMKDYSGT